MWLYDSLKNSPRCSPAPTWWHHCPCNPENDETAENTCVCASVLLLQFDWGVLAEVSAVCTSILCYCSELRVLVCIYTSVFGVWPPLHSLLRQELGFFLKRTSLWVYSVCVCVCYTACVSISFLWLCGTQRVITACKWVAPPPPPTPPGNNNFIKHFLNREKYFYYHSSDCSSQYWLSTLTTSESTAADWPYGTTQYTETSQCK